MNDNVDAPSHGPARKNTFSGVGLGIGLAAGFLARDLDLPTLVSYWRSGAPMLLSCAVAFSLLWNTPLRRPLAAACIVLGAFWCVVAFLPISRWLVSDLTRKDPLRPADAVFVLSSRLQTDGEFTTPALTRLLHGLELVNQGFAPRLVLSELPPLYAQYEPAARRLMHGLGMNHELLTVGPVVNTRDEARLVAQLFRERGFKRLLLVSSPTHMRRACAAFEAEGVEVISSPSVETRFDLETLGSAEDRLAAFGAAMHERVGLFVYRMRGWIR